MTSCRRVPRGGGAQDYSSNGLAEKLARPTFLVFPIISFRLLHGVMRQMYCVASWSLEKTNALHKQAEVLVR